MVVVNGEMGGKSQLEQLADEITQNACLISSFLRDNGLPEPSFEPGAPQSTLPTTAPEDILKARQMLMDSALRTFHLAAGPNEFLPHLALGYHYLSCLYWLSYFDIFDKVPLTGSIECESLAELADVPIAQLKAIIRMAMTNRVFSEPELNKISHTAISASFVRNPMLRDWAMFMVDKSAACALKMTDATVKWPRSTSKSHTGFNVSFDTNLPYFDFIQTRPDHQMGFEKYMRMVTNTDGLSLRHLVNGFRWGDLGPATVVDVGGSTGNACIALAQEFTDLTFVVQDAPNVVEAAKPLLNKYPAVSTRVTLQPHDFFTEQPVKGAEVYLLRMILHDWQLADASRILKQLVPALRADYSRIVIMDTVLPRPGSVPAVEEALLRARDMAMLQSFNSFERDLADWEKLMTEANERLRIVNVVQPHGSLMAVIEVALH